MLFNFLSLYLKTIVNKEVILMPLIHSFNKQNFKQKGKFYNAILQNGDKCWIDLEDPTFEEMFEIHKIFHIDMKTLKQYFKNSQKTQVHIFRDYNFTIIRSMNILTLQSLITEPVYLFFSKNWLLTIHSSKINLKEKMPNIFKNDISIDVSSIDTLYYNIISKIIEDYKMLIISVEIAMTDFQGSSLYNPSKEISIKLENLSRQITSLREEFLKVKEILNLFINLEQDTLKRNEYINYLKILYNNIKELIDFIEVHKKSMISIRELYDEYTLFYKLI